jgi:hypothetical protein
LWFCEVNRWAVSRTSCLCELSVCDLLTTFLKEHVTDLQMMRSWASGKSYLLEVAFSPFLLKLAQDLSYVVLLVGLARHKFAVIPKDGFLPNIVSRASNDCILYFGKSWYSRQLSRLFMSSRVCLLLSRHVRNSPETSLQWLCCCSRVMYEQKVYRRQRCL